MIAAPRARRTHATVLEAARMLRMTQRQVLNTVDREKVVRLRGRILIPRGELARLLWAEAPALQH